jgi:hypothetical protein
MAALAVAVITPGGAIGEAVWADSAQAAVLVVAALAAAEVVSAAAGHQADGEHTARI